MERLKNRIAIVTGAGQGIGRTLALGLAREGAKVVVADINGENAASVKSEVEASGGTALAASTDVSNEDSVQTMVDESLREFGKLDILINNAGIFPVSSVEEMKEEDWDRVIGTNLIGAFLCSRAVSGKFLQQGSGRIISITSGRAFQGAKNAAHYASSKAGIIGFSKSLALELAPRQITVNVICPRDHRYGATARPSERGANLCSGAKNSTGPNRPAARSGRHCGVLGQRCRRLYYRPDGDRQWRQHHVVSGRFVSRAE
jgi:3-oxoacyl-[acyl-carrier protein] reductase